MVLAGGGGELFDKGEGGCRWGDREGVMQIGRAEGYVSVLLLA